MGVVNIIDKWVNSSVTGCSGKGSRGNGYSQGKGFGCGKRLCCSEGNTFGKGYGKGNGNGYGKGKGYGSGRGFGNGNGNGNGYGGIGSGSGSGSGGCDFGHEGIKSYNGAKVYYIDDIPTIITAVYGNYAKGKVISTDFSVYDCFIAKRNDYFAHGHTLKEAQADVLEKVFAAMSAEERIEKFLSEVEPNEQYPARTFFEWHNILTGSCEFGREQFCKKHNIDLDKTYMDMHKFLKLTRDSYGGEIIREIQERLKEGVNNGMDKS